MKTKRVHVTIDSPIWVRDVYEVEVPADLEGEDLETFCFDAVSMDKATLVVDEKYLDSVGGYSKVTTYKEVK